MACQIIYKNGKVDQVLAPNGQESLLYMDLMLLQVEPSLEKFFQGRDPIELYQQIYTDEFQMWFGDSEFVDQNGEPKIYFHGTNNEFNKFDPTQTVTKGSEYPLFTTGFFFAENKGYSKTYGDKLVPVFLTGKPKQVDRPMYRNVSTDEFYREPALDSITAIDSGGNEKVAVVRYPQQIKSVFNTGLFRDTENNIYYSDDMTSGELDPIIRKKLDTFFRQNGFDVDVTDRIEDALGQPIAASVDIVNHAVRYVDGKSATLPEEAAHVLTRLLPPNHPLMMDLKRKITSFKTYNKVLRNYAKYPAYQNADGTANLEKIAIEAIGQVIAQQMIGDQAEVKEKRIQAQSFLSRIVQAIRRFFMGRSSDFQALIRPFAEASDMILSGYTGTIQESTGMNDVFFSVPTEQQAVLDLLDQRAKLITGINDGVYTTEDSFIKYRVSNIVDKLRKRIFRYATELDPEKIDFLSHKGSISHMYLDTLMNKDMTREQLIDFVYNSMNGDLNRSREFYEITQEQYNEYKKAVKSLKDFIYEMDPNAVIRTEQTIYDPKNDIAGTVDVLVVHSDGRVSIYDYKNIESLTQKGQITRQSFKLYERQIAEYKRIMKEAYGVKDFYKTRIIPIDVKYDGNKFKSIRVGTIDSKEDYLKPLPVAAETTGDAKVDRTLERLLRRRDIIGARLDTERSDELQIEFSRLDKVIKSLQLSGDFMPIVEDMIRSSRYIFKEVDNFTIEDAKKMNDYLSHLELYENFIQDFQDTIGDVLGESKEAEKIKVRINKAVTNSLAARSVIVDKLVDLHNEESGFDLTKGGRVKSAMAALFDGKDQFSNPLFKYYYNIVQQNRENVRRDLNSFITRIDEADKKLRAKHGVKGFEYLIDNNNFIRPYNEDFFTAKAHYKELYKDALERSQSNNKSIKAEGQKDLREAVEWAKKNLYFDKEKYTQRYNDYKESIFSPLSGLSKEEAAKMLSKYEKLSPENDTKAWFDSGFVRANVESMDAKYKSSKWTQAESMPEVKEYLDAYIGIMNEIREMTGSRFNSPYFLPQIEKDMIDKLTSGGISMGQILTKSINMRQNDEVTGLHDEDGNSLKHIPLLFSDPIKGKLNTKDEREIKEQMIKEGYKEGTADFEIELDSRKVKKAYEKGKTMVSTDLTRSLILFADAALTYKHNNETLDLVMNLRHILNERQYVYQSNSQSKIIKNQNSRDLVPTIAGKTETLQQFDHFVDYDYYGIRTRSKDKTFNINGDEVSLTKVAKQTMNYQTIVALGLNPLTALANYANAKFQLQFIKAEGLHFTPDQFTTTIKGYGSNEQDIAIQSLFEIDDKGTTYTKALKRSGNRSREIFSMRGMMTFNRWGDDHIKRAILGAMAKNYVIDVDGKVRSKSGARIQDASRPSLHELIQKDEDGNFHIPGLSEAEFARFRSLVFNVANKITGTMSDDQIAQINTNIWGQLVMKFRSWLPGIVRERLGDVRYDPLSEEMEVGRFRVFVGEIFGHGIKPNIKNMLKELGRLASFGIYNPDVDMKTSKAMFEAAQKRNPDLYLEEEDFEEFVKMRERKLKSMASELRVYLGLLALMQLAVAGNWDDDDASFFSQFAFSAVRRLHLEMSFFFEPRTSGIQLIQSPVPMAKVLIDFGRMFDNLFVESMEGLGVFAENKKDKTPAEYYVLKQTPVVNHVLDVFGYFYKADEKYFIERIFAK